MAVEIKVPALGESVTEATVAKWLVKAGDTVAIDQPLCELETDKVTVEVNASVAGSIVDLAVEEGATVQVGGALCHIEAGAAGAAAAKPLQCRLRLRPLRCARAKSSAGGSRRCRRSGRRSGAGRGNVAASGPATRKLVEETGVAASAIQPTGKDGRATKADVMAALSSIPAPTASAGAPAAKPAAPAGPRSRADREERVRMTRLRRTIANRLKEAQNTAAMLTTFNEVDMTNVMALRERLKEDFEKKHGARLGSCRSSSRPASRASRSCPRSMPRSRATTSSTRTTTISLSPSARRKAWSCQCCAMPTACLSARWRRVSASLAARRATASSALPT